MVTHRLHEPTFAGSTPVLATRESEYDLRRGGLRSQLPLLVPAVWGGAAGSETH